MNVKRPSGYGSENQTGETYAGYGGKPDADKKKKKNKKHRKKIEKKGDIAELQK
jgi:hypothetical protein